MIRFRTIAGCAAAAACLVSAARAEETDAGAIVAAQFAAGGNHTGVRASGAKGVCLKGAFAPAPGAAALSKAPHFTKTVPVTARFSMGGSNPKVSDKAKPVTRGFAMRMEDPAGDLVFVVISAPVFSTKTPAQLLEFLQVRAPGPDGKPDAEKIKAFSAQNPETTRQAAWLNARPVPASYAGVDYWAVHAYTLTNAKNEAKVAKLKFVSADKAGLTDDELKAKPDSFYVDELKERLAKGPARFDLVAILAEPGDPTADPTAAWPEESRKTETLGTLSITAIAPDATCDARTFDPVAELPDGVAGPSDDPMFAIRSPAYAVSVSRRTN
ncbi:catalase family peroxidase [Methylobacterium radiodurans]|uniref:Catalase-related peroxidase n=1 Tax=Methylobacterium radiodurans TaxID=2202828 RepID=A0A2U8VU14_9HYPH|nr:catalase family peroxidase [Methylobacterium radiodurans]AWN37254.1 catalase [Methylobacterium radiodurans]